MQLAWLHLVMRGYWGWMSTLYFGVHGHNYIVYIPHIIDSWKQVCMAWGILWGALVQGSDMVCKQFVILTFIESVSSWQLCTFHQAGAVLHKTIQYNYQETCMDDYWEYSLYNFLIMILCEHQNGHWVLVDSSGTCTINRSGILTLYEVRFPGRWYCDCTVSFEVTSEWDMTQDPTHDDTWTLFILTDCGLGIRTEISTWIFMDIIMWAQAGLCQRQPISHCEWHYVHQPTNIVCTERSWRFLDRKLYCLIEARLQLARQRSQLVWRLWTLWDYTRQRNILHNEATAVLLMLHLLIDHSSDANPIHAYKKPCAIVFYAKLMSH